MRNLIVGLLVLGAGPLAAQVDRSTPATSFGTVVRVDEARTTLQTLIDQPAAVTLSKEDLAAYQKQTEWLKSVLTRLEVSTGVKAPRDVATGQASGKRQATAGDVVSPRDAASGMPTGKRQHKPMMMTPELESFFGAVENESRQFNTLSNASKARHDIAMNAIRNMKA
jgi:hypothetical protein